MISENPPPLPPAAEEAPPPMRLRLPLSRPWLAMTLVALNVLIHAVMSAASSRGFIPSFLGGPEIGTLIRFGAKVNDLIVAGEYWRLFTPIFLHIGILHLLFNQYALAIFGKELESVAGTARFAVIYLLSGLAGSLASFAMAPNISAGASGAIFGVIGAMALFFWRNREILGQYASERARSLGALILINLLLVGQLGNIDNYAHVGGLIGGLLTGLFLVPTYRVELTPADMAAGIAPVLADRSSWLAAAVLAGGLALVVLGLFVAIPRAPLLMP